MRFLLFVCLLVLAGHAPGLESQVPQAPASPPPGVITGIVRDESGTPVVGAMVQAIVRRKRWAGPYYETAVGRPDESDDRGQFRLHSLPPGTYVVAASLQPLQPQQPTPPAPPETTEYVRTYSPDVTALVDAQPISVGPGSEHSVSIRLARVRFVSVSGIARTSAGEPAVNFAVWLRGGPATVQYTGTQGGFLTTLVAGTQVAKDGSFSLSRVPAGSYVLVVTNGDSRRAQNQPLEIAEMPVEVSGTSLNGMTVVTAPGAQVSGRLEWRGSGPSPWLREPRQTARIRATGFGRESNVAAVETELQPDGTFRFPNMYALRRIVTMSLSINWTIAAVEGPKDLMVGRSIDIKPGRDITDLRVIVIARPGALMATMSDEGGRPYNGWLVLMSRNPDDLDAMGWGLGILSNYGEAGIGYYRMEPLTPGPYLVAAVDVEPHRLRDDTELMERARAGAVPVDIREGEQTRLNVRLVRLRPFVQNP